MGACVCVRAPATVHVCEIQSMRFRGNAWCCFRMHFRKIGHACDEAFEKDTRRKLPSVFVLHEKNGSALLDMNGYWRFPLNEENEIHSNVQCRPNWHFTNSRSVSISLLTELWSRIWLSGEYFPNHPLFRQCPSGRRQIWPPTLLNRKTPKQAPQWIIFPLRIFNTSLINSQKHHIEWQSPETRQFSTSPEATTNESFDERYFLVKADSIIILILSNFVAEARFRLFVTQKNRSECTLIE